MTDATPRAGREPEVEDSGRDALYRDRNTLAVAFAVAVHRLHIRYRMYGHPRAMDYRTCWREPAPDDGAMGPDDDPRVWATLYVWVDGDQVSWHVPRELVEDTPIPRKEDKWDGHTRPEKADRLIQFTRHESIRNESSLE